MIIFINVNEDGNVNAIINNCEVIIEKDDRFNWDNVPPQAILTFGKYSGKVKPYKLTDKDIELGYLRLPY